MFGWLKRDRKVHPAPLQGAPAIRRQKTYSALSGYVYQYFYEGMRPVTRDGHACTEYVFDVSSDRRTSFALSVYLPEDAAAHWERHNGRALSSTERYAVAKLTLFETLDERPTPEAAREPAAVTRDTLGRILADLDV